MSSPSRPLSPVKPTGMEIIFFYVCPYCGRNVPKVAPTRPSIVTCEGCDKQFPVVPVDERNIRFMKTMCAGGKACIDPDFI